MYAARFASAPPPPQLAHAAVARRPTPEEGGGASGWRDAPAAAEAGAGGEG